MNLHEQHCHTVVENNPGVCDHGLSILRVLSAWYHKMVQMTRVG
jgi:hypothetical protein